MTIDKLINFLVTITLIEMMVAIGLGVTFADLVAVARNWRLVARAALANYVCVPVATVGLLLLFALLLSYQVVTTTAWARLPGWSAAPTKCEGESAPKVFQRC